MLFQVIRQLPIDGWVGVMLQGFNVSSIGNAHDLHGVVDEGFPTARCEIVEAAPHCRADQVVKDDHGVGFRPLLAGDGVLNGAGFFVLAIDEDERPFAGAALAEFVDGGRGVTADEANAR